MWIRILILPLIFLYNQAVAEIPEPRGLPNISQRTSGHWEISADALAWYLSEQPSTVWADIFEVGSNESSFTAQNIPFDWSFGFRIGAGYNIDYDEWDTRLGWTWFRTKANQSRTVNPEFFPLIDLVTQSIGPEFFSAAISSASAQSANINWTLLFNMFDWELGRSFWVSKGLEFRPFIGVKGGWIDQSIRVEYENLIVGFAPTSQSGTERLTNNFWGVGPVSGVNSKWKVHNYGSHFPSLFGDFSAATMWGHWSCSDLYNTSVGETVTSQMRNSTLGALMLRGFMGGGWDVDFNKGKSHFAIQIGYEVQAWFNQLRVATIQLERLHGDLTLQGLTFNCEFDF